ncbi:MAG: bile acid:sodium symporter [Desulfovibrionaceae bacterium]|nr:bile acid:sodium symporter [Desulfovibrionaceae bacterium]MDD4952515.1 bile acid:sodium symporter [Desulfovibrionaceae bacterium]
MTEVFGGGRMRAFFARHWFFVGIAGVVLAAFALPGLGLFIKRYSILKAGIFIAFFITGLTLETSSVLEQLKKVKVLAAALVSSLALFPLAAFFLAKAVFAASPDTILGVLLIAVAPVTVASGTVMTAMGLGNVSLSLFICVLGNFAALVSIPFSLNLFLSLGGGIDLPVFRMLQGLLLVVLLPTLLGQLVRPRVRERVRALRKTFSVFSQSIVLLIILNAVSSSASRIAQAGPAILLVFAFMIFLHSLFLAVNYLISKFINLDRPSTTAFTIHTSQKTLTVTYIVWAGWFAASHPMSLIPPIAYHLTQMIMDTVLARRFRRSAMGRAADPACPDPAAVYGSGGR